MWDKCISLLLIVLGEVLTIYAEIYGAKLAVAENELKQPIVALPICFVTAGAWCLLLGYMLGMRSFQDIWVVTVMSVTSVLIVEPVLLLLVFGTLPSVKVGVAMILGMSGLIILMQS